jgi:hypothetical protein
MSPTAQPEAEGAGGAPAAWAENVSIADYDAIHAPDIGWVRIRQFRRDPEGAFSVLGLDAEGGWVADIPLPHGVAFRVR